MTKLQAHAIAALAQELGQRRCQEVADGHASQETSLALWQAVEQ
jgi:hypothetical protein